MEQGNTMCLHQWSQIGALAAHRSPLSGDLAVKSSSFFPLVAISLVQPRPLGPLPACPVPTGDRLGSFSQKHSQVSNPSRQQQSTRFLRTPAAWTRCAGPAMQHGLRIHRSGRIKPSGSNYSKTVLALWLLQRSRSRFTIYMELKPHFLCSPS